MGELGIPYVHRNQTIHQHKSNVLFFFSFVVSEIELQVLHCSGTLVRLHGLQDLVAF